MNVAVIGGGPAGLYVALLLRKAHPDWPVTVVERNAPDDTFGWGVVFSDQTLENFRVADEPSYRAIVDHFAHWDDIDVHVHGRTITSSGHGFSGIARKQLLRILQERARAVGVQLRFRTEVRGLEDLEALGIPADLVVAADGVNSTFRQARPGHFQPLLDPRPNHYIWFGTRHRFDAFTFAFIEHGGELYWAHAYRFDDSLSTFIVECGEKAWRAAGFDQMDATAAMRTCERMFATWLGGEPLLYNATPHRHAAPWTNFLRMACTRWFDDRVVLLGDAAHTAHFSIGSGTKLAMEDAIALAQELSSDSAADAASLPAALARYQEARMTEVLRLQNAARNSMEWFEHVERYYRLAPEQFAYSLLTRSQRVSHENLRVRDRAYLDGVERWFAARASAGRHASPTPPPMLTPFALRALTLANRVVVSPMDMYSATDGTPNDFHLVHYGARALGGAGLVVTEMTCVTPQGRITPGCTGLYAAVHAAAWRRLTDFVHQWSAAKIALQLGHSGRKGAVKSGLEHGDEPLDDGGWEVIAPSAIPYRATMATPRAMTRADMTAVCAAFVRATQLAVDANFDMLELHCAHGYLLSSFITPLSNQRQDEYGGSLENRLRFPLEVFNAIRAAWPAGRPISVRISATDWVDGGVDGTDAVVIAKAFHDAGADILHVSTGQTTPDARPVYGRMWQTPFSDRIRNELGIPTIAVGSITDADQVNSILSAGRADLCALARPHLADPNWTLHAAAQLGWREQPWPWQYSSGKDQLERLLERAATQQPR